jgi:hypothetical protein
VNTSAIVMLVVVSLIFVVGLTLCVVVGLRRARAETYGEAEGPDSPD